MTDQRIRSLRCACCDETVRGRQWWNRDTGFGVCERCADVNTAMYGEGSPEETHANPGGQTTHTLYGRRGYHFAVREG